MQSGKKNNEPKGDNANADFNSANRDFQRREEETDSIFASEKESKKATKKANTKPTRNKIN